MEKNTKNFDRGIEQMMNEHEVAPPFGMWNRISSELEAMPAAVAAAGPPVATSLIPKRAMMGIIAAALVIGATVITGYMVNNSKHEVSTVANTPPANTTPIATSTKTVTQHATAEQTVPVKNVISPLEIALTKVKVKHIVATNPVQSTILVAKQVVPSINQPVVVNEASGTPINANESNEVPTPVTAPATNAEETQTYYFPPIDVNTPAKAAPATKPQQEASSNDDRPREHKIRFRPRKRNRYTYPNIIR